MGAAILALKLAGASAFVLLGLVNLRTRATHRQSSYGYLGLALGMLGLITLIDVGVVSAGIDSRFAWDIEAILLLGSGYSFLLFRDAFLPLSSHVKRLTTLLLTGILLFGLVVGVPGGPDPRYTPVKGVAVLLLLLAWSACTVEPIIRFWSASRNRPPVQRARVRALSAAYAGVVVLLFVLVAASASAERTSVVSLVAYGLGLLMAPVLSVSFAPPAWFRSLWRGPEEREQRTATRGLLAFSPEPEILARRAVAGAVRIVGARAGFLADHDGTLLAVEGLEMDEASALSGSLRGVSLPSIDPLPGTGGDHSVAVPFASHLGNGVLAVVSGPFTPVFGSHDVDRLMRYGREVSLALDRVRLVEALEEETARYETLLQAASDMGQGVLLADSGRLVFANQAYVDLTGYSFEELASLGSLVELTVPEDRAAIERQLRTRLAGGAAPARYETAFLHKDGHRVDVEVAVKLLPGERHQIVSLVRDITERKRVEAALRDTFERQREAVEQLRRTDEMKNAFLTAVSHELRTPLTAVLGYALTLEHQYATLGAGERVNFLGRLAHNARKLDRLLSDLLDLGRLTRGVVVPDLRRTDVGALVRRVIREADIGTHPLVVTASSVQADVDAPKVERMVENLLANAARHTPTGTTIRVAVGPHPNGVLICVEDDGPGVPPELRTSIFQPFERGPDTPSHSPGTGIGLALVARFAELHGGRAWVAEGPGGGASFNVTLPTNRAGGPPVEAIPREPFPFGQSRAS